MKNINLLLFLLAMLLVLILLGDSKLFPFLLPFVFAHCDTMDGPVIKDAQKALEIGNDEIRERFNLVMEKKRHIIEKLHSHKEHHGH